MHNLEEAIRERAYHLWIADGRPEGNADAHWLNAQREILTMPLGSPVSPSAETILAEPAKTAKAPRSGKSKRRVA